MSSTVKKINQIEIEFPMDFAEKISTEKHINRMLNTMKTRYETGIQMQKEGKSPEIISTYLINAKRSLNEIVRELENGSESLYCKTVFPNNDELPPAVDAEIRKAIMGTMESPEICPIPTKHEWAVACARCTVAINVRSFDGTRLIEVFNTEIGNDDRNYLADLLD